MQRENLFGLIILMDRKERQRKKARSNTYIHTFMGRFLGRSKRIQVLENPQILPLYPGLAEIPSAYLEKFNMEN